MTPRVSVIIPVHRFTDVARRCVETCLALPGEAHEVLVVSDAPIDGLPAAARALTTNAPGDSSPAEKRDLAFEHARGEICAYIDDDAWPAEDWLDRALARFDADPTITAVGGPGVTPPESTFAARAGGAFYESRLGSGSMRNRFASVGAVTDTDDWPAFNFFVRRQALAEVGGWASKFYGGEDTKLCLALVDAGYRIVADPAVVVFHARRPIFAPHMRQVHNVGRHRGWFVHRFPATSARPLYFAPALALLLGPPLLAYGLSGPRPRRRATLLAGLLGWLGTSVDALRQGSEPAVAAVLPAVLAAGHGAYGAGFIEGLLFTDTIDEM
jgi:glycosyltransferase involved in cell wall biosynthesis